MTSYIYYKLLSSREADFDKIQFDGSGLHVKDLKDSIKAKYGINSNNLDIKLKDDQEKELTNDSDFVKKYTKVFVKRVPKTNDNQPKKKISNPEDMTPRDPYKDASTIKLNPGIELSNLADLKQLPIEEKVKISVQRSTDRYSDQTFSKKPIKPSSRISPNYVCHKCNIPGHLISDCPGIKDSYGSTLNHKEVKRPTGIPQKDLLKVEPGFPGAYLGVDGHYYVTQKDAEAIAKGKKEKRAFSKEENPPYNPPPSITPPDIYLCPLCHNLLTHPTQTFCCKNKHYCRECLVDNLFNPNQKLPNEDVAKRFQHCPTCNSKIDTHNKLMDSEASFVLAVESWKNLPPASQLELINILKKKEAEDNTIKSEEEKTSQIKEGANQDETKKIDSDSSSKPANDDSVMPSDNQSFFNNRRTLKPKICMVPYGDAPSKEELSTDVKEDKPESLTTTNEEDSVAVKSGNDEILDKNIDNEKQKNKDQIISRLEQEIDNYDILNDDSIKMEQLTSSINGIYDEKSEDFASNTLSSDSFEKESLLTSNQSAVTSLNDTLDTFSVSSSLAVSTSTIATSTSFINKFLTTSDVQLKPTMPLQKIPLSQQANFINLNNTNNANAANNILLQNIVSSLTIPQQQQQTQQQAIGMNALNALSLLAQQQQQQQQQTNLLKSLISLQQNSKLANSLKTLLNSNSQSASSSLGFNTGSGSNNSSGGGGVAHAGQLNLINSLNVTTALPNNIGGGGAAPNQFPAFGISANENQTRLHRNISSDNLMASQHHHSHQYTQQLTNSAQNLDALNQTGKSLHHSASHHPGIMMSSSSHHRNHEQDEHHHSHRSRHHHHHHRHHRKRSGSSHNSRAADAVVDSESRSNHVTSKSKSSSSSAMNASSLIPPGSKRQILSSEEFNEVKELLREIYNKKQRRLSRSPSHEIGKRSMRPHSSSDDRSKRIVSPENEEEVKKGVRNSLENRTMRSSIRNVSGPLKSSVVAPPQFGFSVPVKSTVKSLVVPNSREDTIKKLGSPSDENNSRKRRLNNPENNIENNSENDYDNDNNVDVDTKSDSELDEDDKSRRSKKKKKKLDKKERSKKDEFDEKKEKKKHKKHKKTE